MKEIVTDSKAYFSEVSDINKLISRDGDLESNKKITSFNSTKIKDGDGLK